MKYLFASLLLMFSSCKLLNINQNLYDKLSVEQQQKIPNFSIDRFITPIPNFEDLAVMKLNYEGLMQLSEQQEYTWVHTFVPSCNQFTYLDMLQLIEISKQYTPKLQLVFLSNTYDIPNLYQLAVASDYKKNIFVLNNQDYSSNTTKALKKLNKELMKGNTVSHANKSYYGDYLIKNGKVIYVKDWKDNMDTMKKAFQAFIQ